ncbi:MAG: hypothetical protein KDA57_15465 [Planctomycetales bacterium]|nr:hypothetical protein [Planctomycetales bacterium]
MTAKPEPISNEQVDAYLDGLMRPEEREAFELRLREHPGVAKEIELQLRIDEGLKRNYPLEQVSEGRLAEVLGATLAASREETTLVQHRRPWSRAKRASMVGLAAALAWVIVAWQLGDGVFEAPYFQPQPVAMVYQEVVNRGFEPYYECREDDRFEATFLRRQGLALSLAAMPAGSEMLGLSFAGGLSRETTAMLCRVDGREVIVFVDRLANDLSIAEQNDASEIKVFRVARDGLVFYEVTPFDAARVIEFLVPKHGSQDGA